MADGLIMTDATGEVFLINPAARAHARHRRHGGIDEAVTAKYLKEKLGFYPFDLVRSTNASEPLREELKVNDRFLHSIVSPVNDAGGAAVGVVVVLRDITEQKALDHRKEEFVSIVSHELRTPLTSITGALDIVLEAVRAGAHRQADALRRDGARLGAEAQRHRRRSARRGQGRARQAVDAHGRARSGGSWRATRSSASARPASRRTSSSACARPTTARCASSATPIG